MLTDAPLFKGDGFYVLGMRSPARKHGVMVIPYHHVETTFELNDNDWLGFTAALRFAKSHLADFHADGYSVGWNVGAAGGQHVCHAHLHVICRFGNQPSTGLGLNGLIRTVNAASP